MAGSTRWQSRHLPTRASRVEVGSIAAARRQGGGGHGLELGARTATGGHRDGGRTHLSWISGGLLLLRSSSISEAVAHLLVFLAAPARLLVFIADAASSGGTDPAAEDQARASTTSTQRSYRSHAASTAALPRLRLLSQSWICGGAWCWSTAAADSEPAAASLPRPPSLSLSRRSSGLLPLPPLFSGVAARPGGAAWQLGCQFRLLARPEAGTAGPRRRGVCRSSRTTPGMASGGRNWMVPSRIPSPAAAILPLKATWRWLCGCGPGPSADSLKVQL
jgi:hypothetical protein